MGVSILTIIFISTIFFLGLVFSGATSDEGFTEGSFFAEYGLVIGGVMMGGAVIGIIFVVRRGTKTQDYFCEKCSTKLEFKGDDLFSICEQCGERYRLPDNEWQKTWEKRAGKGTGAATFAVVAGWLIGGFICIVGLAILYEALQMPAFFAGQYLMLGMMMFIGGCVVIGLVTKYGRRSIKSRATENVQEDMNQMEKQFGNVFDNESKTGNFCESCGNPLKPTAKFCGGCGTQRS